MRVAAGFFALLVGLALSLPAVAQYNDIGYEVGVGGGIALDTSKSDDAKPGPKIRACLAYPLFDMLQGEFGYAFEELRAKDRVTVMSPIDLRLKFSPVHSKKVVPFLYAGIGMLYFEHRKGPAAVPVDTKRTGWTPFAPLGVGVQYRLDENFSLELHGGFNQTFSKDVRVDADRKDNDGFVTALLGVRVGSGPRNPDLDGDSLLNRDEKLMGTDPKNPDTDGDGLTDGEEVHQYHTDPLKADTDGDGLSDGDEVHKYHTDPLKADTDGDGLNDGVEVNQYHTDPLKADTDGDGLNDGAEVNQYHSDPLKVDTDGDGLNDGTEINQYHTDPLKADTDGGSVNDAVEVERGSNPLNAADDVPKIVMEINKPIVLPGIVFKSNSADILPASEQILNDAYETLRDNTNVAVEIGGHTDDVGKDASNQTLSEKRAESVKAWLVAKGISADRLTIKGYGETKPVADNKTEAGRQQNRRIEFTRTK